PAHTAAQRAGPNTPVARLIDREDAVLSQSVNLGVGLGGECIPSGANSRQAAALSSQPQLAFAARDGVNDIVIQTLVRHASTLSVLHPPQSALRGSKPRAVPGIHENGVVSLRRQTFGPGICHKRAVPEALDAARAANPHIAFSVLEDGCDCFARA